MTDLASANGTFDAFGLRLTEMPVERELRIHLGAADGVALDLELVDPPEGSTRILDSYTLISDSPPPSVAVPYITEGVLTIGRDGSCDVVVDDVLVSRHHADVHLSASGGSVVDHKSSNGTYVDGRRVRQAPLSEGSIVTVGRTNFALRSGVLAVIDDPDQLELVVEGLRVEDRTGRAIIRDISFEVPPSSLVAIIGPSGAGKSTVVKAIVGAVRASAGHVFYGGLDLLNGLGSTRRGIGYVPQDDILHSGLTVERSLYFAARLRLAHDTDDVEIEQRISRVLEMLGLSDHRTKRIDQLSGGQRKRASTAMELLTEPPLLVLDEPSSGLDPGNEKSLMELLADLAHDDATSAAAARRVLVVTHSVQSLELCDLVLVLSPGTPDEPGGRVAYYGPPAELFAEFEVEDHADVYRSLETGYRTAENPGLTLRPRETRSSTRRSSDDRHDRSALPRGEQFRLLTRRYVEVLRADRSNLILIAAQVPVIGAMLALITGGAFERGDAPSTGLMVLLLGMVLSMTYVAASNAIREIVKESAILQRELALGVDPVAYVASKVAVLGAITAGQAVLLVLIATSRAGPLDIDPLLGPLLLDARVELMVIVAATGLAAVGLALLVSALVSNADRAMSLLPVVLLAMYLLSGGPTDLDDNPGLEPVSWANSARWGLSASARTVDADGLLRCDGRSAVASVDQGACRDSWERDSAGLLTDLAMLVVIGGGTVAATVWTTDRRRR